jgi:EAL domain-containing protein (putative c-di-GMP-specific phosphodiesterase class I)
MYRAKSTGRDLAVYHSGTDTEQPDRMGLFGELRTLLDSGDPDGRLMLHYQPILRVSDGVAVGVEALVRWRHPDRGILAPGAFLPIAEHRGLAIPLTYHLVEVAARQAARWRDEGHPYPVSVNVSPRCLLDEDFAPVVATTLRRVGVTTDLIRLEITESAVMTDPDRALVTLWKIHNCGIQLSVDDFGTGFNSLSQLKQLPANEVKIDRSFIRDLATDNDDATLVRGTIELAHNLGLTVVAEGVEDLAALAMLRRLGCDKVQGFALSRPVAATDLPAACQQAERFAAAEQPARSDAISAQR